MNETVTVGKRLIPFEHIALIEPFDTATQLPLPTERSFQARVILLNRESVLTEEPLATFPEPTLVECRIKKPAKEIACDGR
jgi:hypothetical protein